MSFSFFISKRQSELQIPVIIEPGQKFPRLPVGIRCLPAPVTPQKIRLVVVHQLVQFWHRLPLTKQNEELLIIIVIIKKF